MNKLIIEGEAAMSKILEGVNLVANPVKSTIGPLGRLVLISKSYIGNDFSMEDIPVIATKDGYRVSQSISSKDLEVQVGVKLVQEACEKQMAMVGDATSTTALLTQALLEGGLKLINGSNHVKVVYEINKAVDYVVSELKKMAIPINGDIEKIRQVATISANNDAFIGNLIAEAFGKIGSDGVISIEQNKGRETTIKVSDGIKFNRGWVSPYFVTNKAKGEAVLDNPYILIYDKPITQVNALMPVVTEVLRMNEATKQMRPLVIFCDDIEGDALATLTFNMQQGKFQSCAVNMAFLGQRKADFMEDIAAATGGIFINELKGVKLENVTIEMLGQAQKITVGKEDTIIMGGVKDEKIFNNLVSSLKELEAKEDDEIEKDLIKRRIARLNGAIAILSVGATTEVELKEKIDRVDDAVKATRAAIDEGIIIGGGSSFLKINMVGYSDLVKDAIAMPFTQLCINAGRGESLLNEIVNSKNNFGYNVKTYKFEDLFLSGVIEPAKSNICALQNAASVVTTILSSQFLITDTL